MTPALCCVLMSVLTVHAVPGFQDAIRAYVLHSIGITFRRISSKVLADWLKLEPPALKQLLADKVCMYSIKICGGAGGQGVAGVVLMRSPRAMLAQPGATSTQAAAG
jgi:hypothetical protein